MAWLIQGELSILSMLGSPCPSFHPMFLTHQHSLFLQAARPLNTSVTFTYCSSCLDAVSPLSSWKIPNSSQSVSPLSSWKIPNSSQSTKPSRKQWVGLKCFFLCGPIAAIAHPCPITHNILLQSCFMHCLSCYAQIAGRDAAILIMKQNATVKAAQSYLYILGGVTDLSLEKTWLFFFNWGKHYGMLFNLRRMCLRSDMKRRRQ